MIQELAQEYDVDWLCQLFGLPRSTYYYQPTPAADDPDLVQAIESLLADKPYLGYRMVLARLKQAHWRVGERPVRRILHTFGRTRSAGRLVTTDSNHSHPRYPNMIRGQEALYPNHIWVADLTYLRYGRQYLYLALILDVYTRMVRGWHLEEFLNCEILTLPALQKAFTYGCPVYFHSDQGRQYAATAHVQLLKEREVIISMSDAGQPTQNAFIERFIKTVKYEHVYYSEYDTVTDMRKQLKHYLEVEYNRDRPHSALGYLTPNQFEKEYYWLNRFFDY